MHKAPESSAKKDAPASGICKGALLRIDIKIVLVAAQTLFKSGLDTFLFLFAAQNEPLSAEPAANRYFYSRTVHWNLRWQIRPTISIPILLQINLFFPAYRPKGRFRIRSVNPAHPPHPQIDHERQNEPDPVCFDLKQNIIE